MRVPASVLWVPALFAAVACTNEGTLINEVPDLVLTVDSPTYGEFVGAGPVEVRGTVSPVRATIEIEGEAVDVAADGTFASTVTVDDPYRIVDVAATVRIHNGQLDTRERVPVFRGLAPLDTWPGGTMVRFTPGGLDAVGRGLGAAIDATGWDQQLLAGLPAFDLGFMQITPTGLTHAPSELRLEPTYDGVHSVITLVDVAVVMEITLVVGQTPVTVPATFMYDEVGVGATVVPGIDPDGVVTLALGASDIVFGTPTIDLGGFSGLPLDFLLSGLTSLIEPLGEGLIDGALAGFDGLPLGGPFDFQTDLFGTTLDVRLAELYTDPAGVAVGLGMGIGEDAPVGPLGIPAPVDDDPSVHLALGLHDAIIDQVLSEQVLGLVSQNLDLSGIAGNLIGVGVLNLPGGADAPETEGWCLSVDPGTAHVARLHEGLSPLAALYLPDVFVDIGAKQDGVCEPWLQASLAMVVGINVQRGTAIGLQFTAPEGAVLFYGADPESWDEAEVVDGLGRFLVGTIDLFAGNFTFDLADILGGLGGQGGGAIPGVDLSTLDVRIVNSVPVLDDMGVQPEGLFSLGLQLFAAPVP